MSAPPSLSAHLEAGPRVAEIAAATLQPAGKLEDNSSSPGWSYLAAQGPGSPLRP